MAIAVTDAVAWATASGLNVHDVTSSAFSVASGDLIIVIASGSDDGLGNNEQPFSDTLTDSATPDQTWTVITSSGAAGSTYHKAWWAIATGAFGSLTVTASRSGLGTYGTSSVMAIKAYTITGHDTSTPIGNTWNTGNTSTTNNWTPNTYASSVDNSRGMAVAGEHNVLGGAPASTDTESASTDSATMEWLSAYKAADTPTAPTTVAFSFNAFGTNPAAWRGIAWEIRPSAGAATIRPNRLMRMGMG
jgi:hypothetical protein